MIKFLQDNYSRTARYYPAVICSIPLSVLTTYFLTKYPNYQFNIPQIIISGTVIISIVSYAFMMICREVGKFVEERLFQESGMATTYLMSYSNTTVSKSRKDKYRELMKKHFNIDLMTQEEEAQNKQEAIRMLNDATGILRTKYQKDAMLFSHNKWYGFYRNLTSGSIIALLSSLFGFGISYYLNEQPILIWMLIFSIIYLLLWVLRGYFIRKNGERYANKAFDLFFLEYAK